MLEPDIKRKCLIALAAAGIVTGGAVFASWWVSGPSSPIAQGKTVTSMEAGEPAPSPAALPETKPVQNRPERVAALPVQTEDGNGRVRELERRAFELEKDNVRLRGRLDDMLNWILDNVRGTFPLPEDQMANLRLQPVNEDMQVSDDLAQVLRLNDEEVDRLDAAFEGTRSVLRDLEAEEVQVETPSENQVVLNIPPYAEEGELVREALYDELVHTLGTARFDRFLQVAEGGLEESFEYFGNVDRLLEFEAMQDETSGEAQLFVRDQRVIPSQDDPLRQDIIASERIVTELPAEYMPYWNWLPDAVTRFASSN